MNTDVKNLFNEIGIPFEELNNLNGLYISREIFLNDSKYNDVKEKIPTLKKYFSSSLMTSLQKNAVKKQKWPLLNLTRQILKSMYFKMTPIRLSNGYTPQGKKLYRRMFLIEKINLIEHHDNNIKIINNSESSEEEILAD